MRVLVVARPGVGGVARVLEAMFRCLPPRGVEGTVVLSGLEGTEMLDAARRSGWDVMRLDMRARRSYGRRAQLAVMPSMLSTARIAMARS